MAKLISRDKLIKQSLGSSLHTKVKERMFSWLGDVVEVLEGVSVLLGRSESTRLLVVGAGGIGCELIKNLVLAGFGEIHIVDLDTIDLSNLNRQFLFRHEHIKKSKALVAKDAAHRFNPNVKLEAYMANIKDTGFNVDWFKSFTMVFNALDNLEARRHVNKMCIAADVPLIESGTTGFNGQVQVIKKGITQCYDCSPKEAPKSFPTCTIRSTPSQPIHCIVWAKSYLLNEIFGSSEDDSPDMDHTKDSENAQEIEKLRQETAALRKIRDAMGSESFPHLLFDKAYKYDVERLRSMEDLWKTRQAPEPLDYAVVLAQATSVKPLKENIVKDAQKVWSVEENLLVFKDSLKRLSQRMAELKAAAGDGSADPVILFDKDDDDTLDFVTASANLRSSVFGIEKKSKFDVKQMAGNIIPAIATTNAIVAGLCVLQSFKILNGNFTAIKELFLSPFAPERLLGPDRIRGPNPDCVICSVLHGRVFIDMSNATLNDLVKDFLQLEMRYGEEITVYHGDDHLLYDVDETINLHKKLSELGIKDGSFLTVVDDEIHDEGPRVNFVLNVRNSKATDGKCIKVLDITFDPNSEGGPASPNIPRRKPKPQLNGHDPTGTNGNASAKRPHSPEFAQTVAKKFKIKPAEAQKVSKAANGTGNGIIEIDDHADGTILIE